MCRKRACKLYANLRRCGLTLMELVVVMVILMGLAAIVLPMFPNMIERVHRASQGTNASEIAKAIQLYQSTYGNYPDGYDLMTDGTSMVNYMPSAGVMPMIYGESPTSLANYLGFQYPVGGYIVAATLDANHAAALVNAGINNLYPLANGAKGTSSGLPTTTQYTGSFTWSPTFNPYTVETSAPLQLAPASGTAATPAVIFVLPSGIVEADLANPAIINGKSTTQFVMFGVGKRCSAVGTTLVAPSYNFPNDAVHENPEQVYERFGVIFQLEDANGNVLPSAQYIGVVAIESNTLLSADKVDESYIENIPQASAPVAGPGI